MAKEKIGKVSVTPKGEWVSGTTYEALDIVRYGGNSWLARQETSTEPVEGENWQRITELTKDGIASVLGSLPKPNGQFELLQDITVAETGITQIVLTETITAMCILFACPSTGSANMTAALTMDNGHGYQLYFNNGYRRSVVYANIVNDSVLAFWARGASAGEFSPLDMQLNPFSQMRQTMKYPTQSLAKFTMATNQTDGFDVGTEIKIYAVKA